MITSTKASSTAGLIAVSRVAAIASAGVPARSAYRLCHPNVVPMETAEPGD